MVTMTDTKPPDLSPKGVEIALKHDKAVELRRRGKNLDQIAQELGYANRSGARKAVLAGLARHGVEDADELRRVQSARLEELVETLWDRALTGEEKAVGMLLSVFTRQAKLLGLDRPSLVEVGGDAQILVEFSPALQNQVVEDPELIIEVEEDLGE